METAKGKTREETINRLADRIDIFEKYTQPHSRLMARACSASRPQIRACDRRCRCSH